MTQQGESRRPSTTLPLTETIAGSRVAEHVSEPDIRALIDRFYETVRVDDLLGPIFARHVGDWSRHLNALDRCISP